MSQSIVTTDSSTLDDFRRARRDGARTKRGPVSFVWGDFVTEPGTSVIGAAGLWSPLSDGAAGLLVHASASEGVVIGGVLVDGQAALFADAADGPTVAHFADGAEGIIFSYDRSKFALQVWNPESEWARRYATIDAFGPSPEWRLDARVIPIADGRTVAIAHHRDPRPVEVPVVAEVSFEVDGERRTLLATHGGPGDGLFVHFRDATNGGETYSAGRGVRVQPDAEGLTVLDFNYATLLPCSFSLAWNCPLPAAENTLPFAVTAGEKNAVDAHGAPLL